MRLSQLDTAASAQRKQRTAADRSEAAARNFHDYIAGIADNSTFSSKVSNNSAADVADTQKAPALRSYPSLARLFATSGSKLASISTPLSSVASSDFMRDVVFSPQKNAYDVASGLVTGGSASSGITRPAFAFAVDARINSKAAQSSYTTPSCSAAQSGDYYNEVDAPSPGGNGSVASVSSSASLLGWLDDAGRTTELQRANDGKTSDASSIFHPTDVKTFSQNANDVAEMLVYPTVSLSAETLRLIAAERRAQLPSFYIPIRPLTTTTAPITANAPAMTPITTTAEAAVQEGGVRDAAAGRGSEEIVDAGSGPTTPHINTDSNNNKNNNISNNKSKSNNDSSKCENNATRDSDIPGVAKGGEEHAGSARRGRVLSGSSVSAATSAPPSRRSSNTAKGSDAIHSTLGATCANKQPDRTSGRKGAKPAWKPPAPKPAITGARRSSTHSAAHSRRSSGSVQLLQQPLKVENDSERLEPMETGAHIRAVTLTSSPSKRSLPANPQPAKLVSPKPIPISKADLDTAAREAAAPTAVVAGGRAISKVPVFLTGYEPSTVLSTISDQLATGGRDVYHTSPQAAPSTNGWCFTSYQPLSKVEREELERALVRSKECAESREKPHKPLSPTRTTTLSRVGRPSSVHNRGAAAEPKTAVSSHRWQQSIAKTALTVINQIEKINQAAATSLSNLPQEFVTAVVSHVRGSSQEPGGPRSGSAGRGRSCTPVSRRRRPMPPRATSTSPADKPSTIHNLKELLTAPDVRAVHDACARFQAGTEMTGITGSVVRHHSEQKSPSTPARILHSAVAVHTDSKLNGGVGGGSDTTPDTEPESSYATLHSIRREFDRRMAEHLSALQPASAGKRALGIATSPPPLGCEYAVAMRLSQRVLRGPSLQAAAYAEHRRSRPYAPTHADAHTVIPIPGYMSHLRRQRTSRSREAEKRSTMETIAQGKVARTGSTSPSTVSRGVSASSHQRLSGDELKRSLLSHLSHVELDAKVTKEPRDMHFHQTCRHSSGDHLDAYTPPADARTKTGAAFEPLVATIQLPKPRPAVRADVDRSNARKDRIKDLDVALRALVSSASLARKAASSGHFVHQGLPTDSDESLTSFPSGTPRRPTAPPTVPASPRVLMAHFRLGDRTAPTTAATQASGDQGSARPQTSMPADVSPARALPPSISVTSPTRGIASPASPTESSLGSDGASHVDPDTLEEEHRGIIHEDGIVQLPILHKLATISDASSESASEALLPLFDAHVDVRRQFKQEDLPRGGPAPNPVMGKPPRPPKPGVPQQQLPAAFPMDSDDDDSSDGDDVPQYVVPPTSGTSAQRSQILASLSHLAFTTGVSFGSGADSP